MCIRIVLLLGNIRVVRRLLVKGANRNLRVILNFLYVHLISGNKSKDNKTAMDIAKDNGYDNIINLLVWLKRVLPFFDLKSCGRRKEKTSSLTVVTSNLGLGTSDPNHL